jgi:subfamily B ATP-binding cassette protein MsbA
LRQQHIARTPNETLPKLSWSAVSRLLKLALPYKVHLGAAAVLMLLSSAVNLSLPLVARNALDGVLKSGSVQQLDLLALALIGLILVSGLFGFVQFYLVAYSGNKIVKELREKLFSHLVSLPVRYFDKTRSGDLASHLSNDVSQVQTTLTSDVSGLFANVFTLVGGIAVLVTLDWKLTLVVVGLLALVMSGFVFFGRRLRKLNREALDALSDAMGAMTEAMANIRLVKAFAREKHEQGRAESRLDKVLKLNLKTAVWEGAMGTVAFVGFVVLLLGVAWYGGRKVITGETSAGSLLAFFMTVTIISGPMGTLASLYTRLQRAVGAADRLFEILDESSEEADQPGARPMPTGSGEVVFSGVEFQYTPDLPVLRDLSLTLNPGTVTALVGPSGSGKTTVGALLYRFFEPQAGSITIDGIPITSIRREALRNGIGLVPQDPILFSGTIKENILYGRLGATDAEVMQAAQLANVDEFVQSFPDHYETLVGERGVTLSGGQRQRVAIARAILKNPKILILDEATSSLDTLSENLVREALDRLMKDRTTLVIAHRLSTVQNADQIAVLEKGTITEIGRHDELLSQRGRYADLYLASQESDLQPA